MSLMTLVRLLAVFFFAWSLAALGIGALGGLPSRPLPAEFLPEPAIHDALPSGPSVAEQHELVDRATGQLTPIRLPESDRWANVSVAPWRDPAGGLMAVGRWVSRGDGEFCGWGIFRLSDSVVVNRVALDVLPMGRACWVPNHVRTILFSGGDGRLHRCVLPEVQPESVISESVAADSALAPAFPVTWRVRPPGVGDVFLADPAWSSEPRLRKWVFLSLNHQEGRTGKAVYGIPKLWWLEMSDRGDAILAAGRLTAAPTGGMSEDNRLERFPSVAVDVGGEIRVVYLARRLTERTARLCSSAIQFDTETGRPCLDMTRRPPRVLSDDLAMAPLLVSADGSKVFGRTSSGRVTQFSLDKSVRASRRDGRRTGTVPARGRHQIELTTR
jgi:hypothetical protein